MAKIHNNNTGKIALKISITYIKRTWILLVIELGVAKSSCLTMPISLLAMIKVKPGFNKKKYSFNETLTGRINKNTVDGTLHLGLPLIRYK